LGFERIENTNVATRKQLGENGVKLPSHGFTDKWVDRSAKVLPFSYVVYDRRNTGLGLKVSPSGKKTWILQAIYPPARMQARRELGRYPAMSLAQAKDKAHEWRNLIDAGRDPKEVEEEKKQEAEATQRAQALKESQTTPRPNVSLLNTSLASGAAQRSQEKSGIIWSQLGARGRLPLSHPRT
jgi:hypothetical protein